LIDLTTLESKTARTKVFMIAAEMITAEAINFTATHAHGLICLAVTGEKADSLELSKMVSRNTSWGGNRLRYPSRRSGEARTCVPLRTHKDGVRERRGQTVAAVDLARLDRMNPSGVICEIVNDDGALVRLPDLTRFWRWTELEKVL
jgi:3,4-dihydroxy 2-butanone 4-phosphate synthase/GTP cyclohydrolase II